MMTYFQRIFMLTAFNLDIYKWLIFLLATDPFLSINHATYFKFKSIIVAVLSFLEIGLFVFQFVNVYKMTRDPNGLYTNQFFNFLYIIFVVHIFAYLSLAFFTIKRLKALYRSFYLKERCHIITVL